MALPDNYELQRLGKQSPNYCSVVKLNVVNKTNRDNIFQKSKELKDATEPWNRVYLKRDKYK